LKEENKNLVDCQTHLELAAPRVLNFSRLVINHMVLETDVNYSDFLKSKTDNEEEDVRVMLGYFNQHDFTKDISIGEFMKI